ERGGAPPRRPLRGEAGAAGTHQADHQGPLPAPARSHHARRDRRVRQAQARHLAGARRRGHARQGGDRAMNGLSAKWRDRALYLISPIALLLVWQLLLMAGFGDRRFIPAPTDIAVRFWRLLLHGELAWNTRVTL